MAKRARGTTTRPGQRRPMQRPAARPAPPAPAPAVVSRPPTLTAEEEARAAELEAAIVASEQAVETTRRARPQRGAVEEVHRAPSSLSVAASNEYAYVARDIRRIVKVGGTLVVVLAALWIYTQVSGVTL